MPSIFTKDLEPLLDAKAYNRIVVKNFHGRYHLIVYDLENRPLIHCNQHGKPKEYRHVKQPLEWLQRKWGIADAIIE